MREEKWNVFNIILKELKYIGPWKLTEKYLNISSTDRKVKILHISSIMVTELDVKTK